MNRDDIRALCPTPERPRCDWADCCAVFPRLEALETTPQSVRYHAEGNVGIHTHRPQAVVGTRDLRDLVCVARADMQGRVCEDQRDRLDDIALFEQLARDDGCRGTPRAAASPHTRLAYARGAAVHLDTPLFQPPGSIVTVLSGLPATGKDTWVARHAPEQPVVSFDDAKAALGLKHGKNDGQAAHFAVDKAKKLLRRREAFVWNATHLGEQMRGKTLDLLYAYDAQVRLVYLESPRDVVFRRNDRRDTTLTQRLPWEAHRVDYELSS